MTDKAPEAFRTISEVAEQLDVPQHVLRFWETRFSQIRPMKRGGGRRYYRPADVDLLKGIRTLLYGEGYTIRGAQKILKDNGIAHVIGIGRGEVSVDPAEETVKAARKTAAKPAEAKAEASATAAPAPAEPRETKIVHELTPAQIDELRLVLTDLAAARRLLVPDQAK
ncbi:MerR family transcriptional regulator [Anderseniella sp. Alg231-50]|uniref:MerR family transcriptional regulator n=1 Tax=Anderseniella sp. Alg231-50 TaxID=1922226 RepID=UPI000D54FF2B